MASPWRLPSAHAKSAPLGKPSVNPYNLSCHTNICTHVHVRHLQREHSAKISIYSATESLSGYPQQRAKHLFLCLVLTDEQQRWIKHWRHLSAFCSSMTVNWSLGPEYNLPVWNDTENSLSVANRWLSLSLFSLCCRDLDGHSGGHSWTGLDSVSQFRGELVLVNT